jgi:hypothetical protein
MAVPLIETFNLESFQSLIQEALADFRNSGLIARIWKKDHSVWAEKDAEISNRLGWLEAPERMAGALPEIGRFVEEVKQAGYTHALLLGMGGSSLAPEVFGKVFGTAKGFLQLKVLDSTDPEAVLGFKNSLPLEKTLFIVSSKSGTTLETDSFLNFFYTWAAGALGKARASAQFAAITDPGTRLERTARSLEFRRSFSGDPDIGGRFSVLSPFGLVPAALIGMDIPLLLQHSQKAARLCRDSSLPDNPASLESWPRPGKTRRHSSSPPAWKASAPGSSNSSPKAREKTGRAYSPSLKSMSLFQTSSAKTGSLSPSSLGRTGRMSPWSGCSSRPAGRSSS